MQQKGNSDHNLPEIGRIVKLSYPSHHQVSNHKTFKQPHKSDLNMNTFKQQQVKSNWKSITYNKPLIIQTIHKINSLTLSPDGKYVASAGEGGDFSIKIWNPQTGKQVGNCMNGHKKSITSIHYSKYGKYIVSGSEDGTIRQWNVETQQQIGQTVKLDSRLIGVNYSPDQIYMVSFQYEYAKVWEPRTGQQVKRKHLAPTPDTYRWDGEDIPIENSQIITFSMSPIQYHAVIQGSIKVLIWDYDLCKCEILQCGQAFYAQYSTDGKLILVVDAHRDIQLWDAISRKNLLKIKTELYIYSVSITPDMKYMITGGPFGFYIWDREQQNRISKLEMKWGKQVILFSLDGQYVIAGGQDAQLRIMTTPI